MTKFNRFYLLSPYYLSFDAHVYEHVYSLKYYFYDIGLCAETRLHDAIRDPPEPAIGIPSDIKDEILRKKNLVLAQIRQFLAAPGTQERLSRLKADEERQNEAYQKVEDLRIRKRELRKLAKTAEKLLSLGSDLDEMTMVIKESVVKHTHET